MLGGWEAETLVGRTAPIPVARAAQAEGKAEAEAEAKAASASVHPPIHPQV